MSRFVIFILIILIIVAFFFGLKAGKTIQILDTPIKTITKTKKVVTAPTYHLKNYELTNCDFSFVVPDYYHVQISSNSAQLQNQQKQITINCGLKSAQEKTLMSLKSLRSGRTVYIQGSKTILKELQGGFDPNYQPATN